MALPSPWKDSRITTDAWWRKCCHDSSAEIELRVTRGLRRVYRGVFGEKSTEDLKLHRCDRLHLEQRARAIETTKTPTPSPVRLGGRYIS